MATGSCDNAIKVQDAWGTCLVTLVGHDSWVQALVFYPGARYLLSVSDAKTLRCWDLSQQGKSVKMFDAQDSFVTCLRWAPAVAKSALSDSASKGKGNDKVSKKGAVNESIAKIFAG
ncbi:hypothetical protein BDV28DRAFT_151300 [Aspergillus coremiiformis]|uniref:WD40-repeat-containing domain protein n=1 Tax=Aspergillus coremiiformis TaxID=138285 RepID=A0A5N6YYN9_9EURO|nr:hypothetical protein BDV28DRAFT_151300 [Aspergillus coremiiformis]